MKERLILVSVIFVIFFVLIPLVGCDKPAVEVTEKASISVDRLEIIDLIVDLPFRLITYPLRRSVSIYCEHTFKPFCG